MATILNSYSIIGLFAVALMMVARIKPEWGRMAAGIFFLVIAFFITVPVAVNAPHLYVEMGRNAVIPFYRWAFINLISLSPRLFLVPVFLYEVVAGVLILCKGKYARLGFVSGILFCLSILLMGIAEIAAPACVLALALTLLLRSTVSRSQVANFSSGQFRSSTTVKVSRA
jgi:hypothetical protein